MAKVRPIYGLRYGSSGGDISRVVSPPYDVISPEMQRLLHERQGENIVHVDFALESGDPGENKYTKSRRYLEDWINREVLVQDKAPTLYYYEQEFSMGGTVQLVRSGFVCGLLLEKFGEENVFPHESTLLSPKIDRLNLMKETGHATSPIFGIYDDRENNNALRMRQNLDGDPPNVEVVDDLGVVHRMWLVQQEEIISDICASLEGKKVFIADGHHRYETALAYRDTMREKGADEPDGAWNYVLIFLAASGDDGLVILPTHRGIKGIGSDLMITMRNKWEQFFTITEIGGAPEDLIRAVEENGERGHALGMALQGEKQFLLFIDRKEAGERGQLRDFPPPVRGLDVTILHRLGLEEVLGISPDEVSAGERVAFYKDRDQGFQDLKGGVIDVFFYLNPVSMEQFMEVSKIGFHLPQKTTYFYPKILTGLVLLPVGEEDRIG
jgi:uncharacterized protein (DUF1015 family)